MIVVFAGAGASKAVNPSEYPTTVEFFQRLPDEISNDKLFQLVLQYLQSQRRHITTIDIEHVLWALDELRTFLRTAADGSSVAGWFLRGNRLLLPIAQTGDFGNIVGGGTTMAGVTDQLIGRIDQLVYDLYSREPNEDELRAAWLPLLGALPALKSRVEIVTTNYDIVLESALALLGASSFVETGRVGIVQPHLDTQLWRDATGRVTDAARAGLLTKLHGSVDWTRGADRIFVGDPTYKGSHERHVIIYPGFKGVPASEPFATLHNYFEAVVSSATIALFIGFAFRDDYINDVLRRSAPALRAVIVNPSDIPQSAMPFREGQFVHLKSPFTADLVPDIIAAMRAG